MPPIITAFQQGVNEGNQQTAKYDSFQAAKEDVNPATSDAIDKASKKNKIEISKESQCPDFTALNANIRSVNKVLRIPHEPARILRSTELCLDYNYSNFETSHGKVYHIGITDHFFILKEITHLVVGQSKNS